MNKKTKKDLVREIAEEMDALDTMLSSLVELLEEKGFLTRKEWEEKIESKISRARGIPKYRDLQFGDK